MSGDPTEAARRNVEHTIIRLLNDEVGARRISHEDALVCLIVITADVLAAISNPTERQTALDDALRLLPEGVLKRLQVRGGVHPAAGTQ